MAGVKVDVKWGKENLKGIEIDYSQPPLVFKNQLFSLTGVAPERQKIMVKGGILKDDGDWAKINLKEGQKLMMMGTADAIPVAPTNATVFVEDLPEDQQAGAMLPSNYTAGLVNLGNTCYMNSTLQCLNIVPELRQELASYTPGGVSPAADKLTVAARDLFGELGKSTAPVAPFKFLSTLRELFPQFAQQGQQGMYMQQDAEECLSQLIHSMRTALKKDGKDPIRSLFGYDVVSRLKCEESGEEDVSKDTLFTLKCNISIDISHLHEGIKLGLKDDREKTSEALGRQVLFAGTSQLESLPAYANVQFVRFFYRTDTQSKAKILRKVAYPMVLDLYDFATTELKAELDVARTAHQEKLDLEAGLAKKQKLSEEAKAAGGEGGDAASGDTEMADASAPGPSGGAAAGTRLTGHYDLVAVLTHKGRSADGGHYVSWVKTEVDMSKVDPKDIKAKEKAEKGEWVNFDDEDAIPAKSDDVLNLSGGGDWHMAYLCLYKARMA